MKVTQIAELLNNVFGEILGEDNMLTENLSNIVSSGQIITSNTDFGENFDNYAGAIVDKVGRTVFWDRVYTADDLGFWRDSFEYGSVLEKIRCEIGDFDDNAEWDLCGQGQDYDSNGTLRDDYNTNLTKHIQDMYKFYPASVQAKYFNGKTTFRAAVSITRKQLREAFKSAAEMGRFISMIENRLRTKLEIAKNKLQKMTLANMMSEHLYASSQAQVVDLQAMAVAELVKDSNGDSITTSTTLQAALADKKIVKFIGQKIAWYRDMMKEPSKLYSATGKYYNHTPVEYSRTIVLSDLDSALRFNVYGDTYNEEFVKLDNYKTVPFWQSSGAAATNSLGVRSSLNIKNSLGHSINQTGILATVFDRDGIMICNEDPEVRAKYNEDGNFTNYFYNTDCSYYTDFDENCLVFTWGTKAGRTISNPTTLTVTLAQGTTAGTKFSVTPGSGNAAYYKIFPKGTTVGELDFGGNPATLDGWTTYTSGSDITGDDVVADNELAAIVVNSTTKAVVSYGQAKITASVIKS